MLSASHYSLSQFKVPSTFLGTYCNTPHFHGPKSVLVSCECSNELPYTCWLRPTKMYSPAVLEAKVWNSITGPKSVSGVPATSKVLGLCLFLVLSKFWWLLTFFGLWLHHSSVCLYDHFSSPAFYISTLACPSLIKTLQWHLRGTNKISASRSSI